MHLLRTDKFSFEELFDYEIPSYAILSHRWDGDESSYQELLTVCRSVATGTDEFFVLAGTRYAKIRSARLQASRRGHNFLWIDICCINK